MTKLKYGLWRGKPASDGNTDPALSRAASAYERAERNHDYSVIPRPPKIPGGYFCRLPDGEWGARIHSFNPVEPGDRVPVFARDGTETWHIIKAVLSSPKPTHFICSLKSSKNTRWAYS